MRLRVHSTRLAVSLLLGTMFVLPVAKMAQASTTPLSASPVAKIASDSQPCTTSSLVTPSLFTYGMPSQFLAITQISSQSVVITQANNDRASSFSPSKTVLKKADQADLKEIVVTPSPAPLATPAASFSPTIPESGAVGEGLNADVLFNMVNNYRAQVGLPAFMKDPRVCAVAISRAPELENEIYGSSYMHAGFKARNLGFSANENMISMRTESEALTWWLNSPVHRAALLGSTKFACIACQGKSCAMIFSNLDIKPTVAPTQPVNSTPSSTAAAPSLNINLQVVK